MSNQKKEKVMANDLGTIIGLMVAAKETARVLALALATDEGKRTKRILLRKLQETGAHKTAALVKEAEKVCKAVALTAEELEKP